jgi:hypothetical protein
MPSGRSEKEDRMICIDTKIPMPMPHSTKAKYPWRILKVGESFLVPGTDRIRLLNGLTSCRAHAQMKTGFRFALRCNSYGVRVWRVS